MLVAHFRGLHWCSVITVSLQVWSVASQLFHQLLLRLQQIRLRLQRLQPMLLRSTSQLGFVGLGVRCFAFRDLQSHCRRAHGHRFHSLPSFAATTASFFWDSGGFWSLRVFVSTRTRPSWPWSPLRLFALSLSNLSVRAHTRRVHTHIQVHTCASHAHGHSHSLLPTFLILYLPTARHAQ